MKNKKGFTLIELMVAMGIIAVLVSLSIVGIQIVQRSLRNTQRTAVLNDLNLYIAGYFNDNGVYPTTAQVTFGTTSITVAGSSAIELSGPTAAGASTTASSTDYCYTSTGSTYSIGILREGGSAAHITTSGTDCTF